MYESGLCMIGADGALKKREQQWKQEETARDKNRKRDTNRNGKMQITTPKGLDGNEKVQKRQKGNERMSTESAPDKVGPSGPKAMRQKGIVADWQKTKE